jgi:hypothetical protein
MSAGINDGKEMWEFISGRLKHIVCTHISHRDFGPWFYCETKTYF